MIAHTCRLCKDFILQREGVQYGRRHHAHHACYLNAGKKLADLHPWQVGLFPYRLLQEHGLTKEADKMLVAEMARERARGNLDEA
jgi:hypothetical protein